MIEIKERRRKAAEAYAVVTPKRSQRQRPMIRIAMRLAAFALLTATSAMAATLDPAAGRRIAERWCVGCHAIGDKEPRSPLPNVRSFATIAQDPASTEMALGAYLVSTHEEMPNIRLSPQQVDDVVAYILSLRRH